MTETQCRANNDDEINIFDLVIVLARRWRLIASMTLLAALASAAVAMMLPNRYQATAKVLALQRTNLAPINAAFKGPTAVIVAPVSSFTQVNLPILTDILRSDTLLQSLARQFRFPIIGGYKATATKSGVIEVIVEDTDPQRAAAIANAAVKELGRIAYDMNLVATPEITTTRDLEKLDVNITTAIKLFESATAPTNKSKPKRGQIIIITTISVAFLSVLLAFILEGIKNIRSQDLDRWEQIISAIRMK